MSKSKVAYEKKIEIVRDYLDGQAGFKEEFPDLPTPFSDLSPSDFCCDAVMWVVGKGISGGIGSRMFDPDNDCTRGQIVTFLWRAMK